MKTILGVLTIFFGALSLVLSLLFYSRGEFEGAQVLVLYAILAVMMIGDGNQRK